jgi:hypothetical protein
VLARHGCGGTRRIKKSFSDTDRTTMQSGVDMTIVRFAGMDGA